MKIFVRMVLGLAVLSTTGWSLLFAMGTSGNSPSFEIIQSRLIRQLYETDRYRFVENAGELEADGAEKARVLMAAFDGTQFSTVNYAARGADHTVAVFELAREYAREGGTFYHDGDVLRVIHLALSSWFENKYDPGINWTQRVFVVPRSLFYTALLLKDHLDERFSPLIAQYAEYNPEDQIAMNRIWVCALQFYWAAYTENAEMLDRLSRTVQGELKIQPRGEEGLQFDYSWLQHGPQLYVGGYGLPVIIEIGRAAAIVSGTPFEFSSDSLGVLSDYVLKAHRWILWRNRIDYSTRGRSITHSDSIVSGKVNLRSEFYRIIAPLMEALDPANKELYDAMIAEMGSTRDEPVSLIGNRFFPSSDYMIHRSPFYFTSVRMHSTRTHSTEQGHSEGFKNYYMADGGNFLYRSGHEYLNIFPVWDWRRVPGVTCEDSDAPIPYIGWSDREQRRGKTDFVGGVSDGSYGACAMRLDKDGIKARKAWFFFDDVYVCLGAGIDGKEVSSPLSTAVNQCLLNGAVFFTDGGPLQNRSGERTFSGACGVYHDQVGYFFTPRNEIRLSAGEQTGYLESIQYNRARGDWRELDFSQFEQLSAEVFSLSVNHPPGQTNGVYEYYVIPGIKPDEMSAFLENQPATILQNRPELQAVYHPGKKLLQAVFYKEGNLMYSDSRWLSVNAPCMVMIQETSDGVKISVSDPSQTRSSIQLVTNLRLISQDQRHDIQSFHGLSMIDVGLPTDEYKGSTVEMFFEYDTARVWHEDFSLTSPTHSVFAVLGGSAENAAHRTLEFGQWVAAKGSNWDGNGTVDGERRLKVSSAEEPAASGVILDPTLFGGESGVYRLEYAAEVSGIAQPASAITIQVYGGRGYNLSPGSTDNSRLIVRTRDNIGMWAGANASMFLLHETEMAQNGVYSEGRLEFEYNGTDAVGILLGSRSGATALFNEVRMIRP